MGKVMKIITSPNTTILNELLYNDIKRKIIDNRKDKVVYEMGNAIMSGKMILFTVPPADRIPDCMPFIVYKKQGEKRVAVNLASTTREVRNSDKSITYELGDAAKVYSILYGAYLALEKFDERTEISPDVLYDSALIWANMFNKPIYDAVGMTNLERNVAYMYFAMKFFLGYIMGCPQKQIDSIVMKYTKETKNDLILYMEEQIGRLGINIYEGLIPFLRMLFNDEVTRIKGIRVANVENTMNVSFYLSKFVTSYSSNALLALCSYPYFIYTVISAVGRSRMVNDKAFDRTFSQCKRELNHLLVNIANE